MPTFIDEVDRGCWEVRHISTDQPVIMLSLTEEVGELAQEVKIANGLRPGPHGKDGVVGEAIDVILCAFDVIYAELGYLNEEILCQMAAVKVDKWIAKHKALLQNHSSV